MKALVTLTIDVDVIAKHRKAGHNVSALVNSFLAGYFKETAPILIEEAKQKTNIVIDTIQKGATAAEEDALVKILLEKARKARALGQNFKELLDEAEKLSGLSRAELVGKL